MGSVTLFTTGNAPGLGSGHLHAMGPALYTAPIPLVKRQEQIRMLGSFPYHLFGKGTEFKGAIWHHCKGRLTIFVWQEITSKESFLVCGFSFFTFASRYFPMTLSSGTTWYCTQ